MKSELREYIGEEECRKFWDWYVPKLQEGKIDITSLVLNDNGVQRSTFVADRAEVWVVDRTLSTADQPEALEVGVLKDIG
jgi:hypothetical protein